MSKEESRDVEMQRVGESKGNVVKEEKVVVVEFDLPRRIAAEFVGTAFLVSVIVGSGVMGDALSTDDGVALLGNTLATWGILFVLITVFGPVSGAHFNPVVSLCFVRIIFSFRFSNLSIDTHTQTQHTQHSF